MTVTPRTPPPGRDPYAPPPRYKESGGKLVRVLILAGVLGVVAAGYALYADDIQEASTGPVAQDEQQFAEAPSLPPADSQAAAPESNLPTEAAPGPAPASPAAEPSPSVMDAPLPAPSTTTDPRGE